MTTGLAAGTAMTLLYLFAPDPEARLRNGSDLRVFGLSRELVAAGHEVILCCPFRSQRDKASAVDYLNHLVQQRYVSEFMFLDLDYPRFWIRLARLIGHRGCVDRLLQRFHTPVLESLCETVAQRRVDASIVVSRRLLFAVRWLQQRHPVVVDWIDSAFLYFLRDAVTSVRRKRAFKAVRSMREVLDAYFCESYYGRQCNANLLVSPVDKKYFDFVTRRPERSAVLMNGGVVPKDVRYEKIRGRLIFSGNMDFPPNEEAALWFIREVLPAITAERPDVVFVVAGANPGPRLRALAGRNVEVTGFVDDLSEAIGTSSLYVAPLVSGGGFKNKIVEAISAGTFVIGTPKAVEFLPAYIRDRLVVGASAVDLALAVLAFLEDPQKFEERLPLLRAAVRAEFSWKQRSQELLRVIGEAG